MYSFFFQRGTIAYYNNGTEIIKFLYPQSVKSLNKNRNASKYSPILSP